MAQTVTQGAAKADADAGAHQVQEQIAALKADIAELTATVARYGRAQAESLGAQARSSLRSVRAGSAEQLATAEDFAARKLAESEEYVRAHPASSVGLAAGIGFVVGLLASRR